MTRVVVIIDREDQQLAGLKMSLGLQRNGALVEMFVIRHEIATVHTRYPDVLSQLRDLKGEFFSDNPSNVERYGFKYRTIEEMAVNVKNADLIIPF